MAAGIDDVAARVVQGQRQTECLAKLYFGDALQDFMRGDEIQPDELVVGPEIAPGGAFGAGLPAWVCGHAHAAICSTVTLSPATVVRRMSRTLVSSKRRTR